MKQIIYADNAATTKLDRLAYDAMLPWLLDNFGNPSQPYSLAREPKRALEKARVDIAACINAEPEEIYFTSGGTEGDNFVIKEIGTKQGCVVTSAFEHHAILNPCKTLETANINVGYIMPSSTGHIEPTALKSLFDFPTGLVSIMFANNEIGTIQPIKELCDIAHSKGWLFHTDAVQAIGHIKIDVKELGVDYLTASAHKFNGPKGVGFLYIKKGSPITPLLEGGSQEKGVRAGTENIPSIVGMATALKNNCQNIDDTTHHLTCVEQAFLNELKSTDLDFVVNGSENKLPGLISISFKDSDGEMLLHRLDLMGIMVSTGAACDSKTTQVSHVLKSIGLDEKYAKGTIRLSFGKNNTLDDAIKIGFAIKMILQQSEQRRG